MKKKVILSLLTGLLVSTLAFSVAGCGDETANGGQGGSQNDQSHEHDWGEWRVTKVANCTEKGEEERVCKTDPTHKETRDIEINLDAHAWDEGKVTKQPNCQEDGEFTYTCKYHKEQKRVIAIPRSDSKVEHVWGEDNKCTVCGTLKYTEGLEYGYLPEGPDDACCVRLGSETTEENIVIPSVCEEEGSYFRGRRVTMIEEGGFRGCTSLKSIIIPDSVTEIGKNAFNNCASLESVTIGDGVTTIGEDAFQGCTSLKNITIPESVTEIGRSAFQGCTNLTSVTISDSVTIINEGTFSGCAGLKSITIPDSVTTIGEGAFRDCTSLESITIGKGVTTIYGYDEYTYVFKGCDNLQRVNITDIAAWCNIEFGPAMSNPLYYAHRLFLNGTEVSELIIPDGVTKIGEGAFRDCRSLESVTIGDGVTTIGEGAFRGCRSLESVTIGDGVTTIGEDAFYGCASLVSVTIPDSVTVIGYSAFSGCTSLTSVTIGGGVTEIGDEAFLGCCRLVEVVNLSYVSYSWSYVLDVYDTTDFESKIKRQDGFVFYEGDEVTYLIDYEGDKTEITLPEKFNGKAYEIREYAFYERDNLKSITIPDSVTLIGEYAFRGCTSLESVTIGNSVTTIGGGAFSGCTSLESITIPDSVTKIGGGAFKSCTSLKTVIIGSGVKEISKDTFSGCESLESVTFENTEEWTINGKAVDVTDSKKNAELLKANMGTWYRS